MSLWDGKDVINSLWLFHLVTFALKPPRRHSHNWTRDVPGGGRGGQHRITTAKIRDPLTQLCSCDRNSLTRLTHSSSEEYITVQVTKRGNDNRGGWETEGRGQYVFHHGENTGSCPGDPAFGAAVCSFSAVCQNYWLELFLSLLVFWLPFDTITNKGIIINKSCFI